MSEETKAKVLSRDDIFSAQDIEYVDVHVPEWGGVIRLQTLTASQAMMFVEMTPEQRANILPKMVCECAINEDGNPLFTKNDVERLAGKSLRAFMKLQTALLEMNGLTEKAVVEAKND